MSNSNASTLSPPGNNVNKDDWVKSHEDSEFTGNEFTISNIRILDEDNQKGLLFKALRACDLHAIRTILQANRNLLNGKMFGYEGSDVYGIIKNSKTKRCYTYTGLEKDGHFYPLHVAAEAGHKNLIILLVKAGADPLSTDYRGLTPEERCTGNGQHAFYELRGLKYEAKERYQGKVDRHGKRYGQGVLYFKPEGYLVEEKQLYRGSFKNNLYHGHGTLYYSGTESIAYIGRFKEGLRHGRGIEFDLQGKKIYSGTFREDKREGRGEEFQENMKIYRGEFSNNVRHGFGIAYFPENSYYFGRYENGVMTGVGINCLSNGDRFEGMFINNKPDGPGSYYERDPYTGNYTGQHAIFQLGRKIKDSNIPFTPTAVDLPDDTNKHLFVEILNSHKSQHSFEVEDELMLSNDLLAGSSSNANRSGEDKSKRSKSSFFLDERLKNSWSKGDWWKVQLGKYLRINIKEARLMGLYIPDNIFNELNKIDETNQASKAEEGEDMQGGESDDEEVDELMGYHFLSCTTLFVAYVYVNSASKVFEDRLINKGLFAEFRDFEAVYHLVIDAVDTYNEHWEAVFRDIQQQQLQGNDMLGSPGGTGGGNEAPPSLAQANMGNSTSSANIGSRRMMFMTEKEKKEELIMKQRAELAIKKGTAELDPEIEKMIGMEVLEALEAELTKLLLLNDGNDGSMIDNNIRTNLPISRKSIQDNILVNNAQFMSMDLMDSQVGIEHTESNYNLQKFNNINNNNNNNNNNSNSNTNSSNKLANQSFVIKSGDANAVNIEDLFDFENLENERDLHERFLGNDAVSSDTVENNENGNPNASNEFAAELLYIMKTSIALS